MRSTIVTAGLLTAIGLFAGSQSAQAATTIDGPVGLGTAASYGALAASELTNTGPTVVTGDIGVSPGSSVTGFTGAPNGSFTGTLHQTDAAAAQAQSDVTTAFNVAASLTPTTSGLSELNGLSLTPGVYSGGALALADNGALTLAGSASSVWVFQAASTLTIGSATLITITGGATACNVFWEVGSSATLGTGAQFQGTVLAKQSITATTGATIVGRLLANTAAVTLDTNTITVPTGCPASGTVTSSPEITSASPTGATAGTPYSYTVTATGTPTPTFTVTSGALPAGLTLNGTTGVISGTPTTAGSSTFTITASNGAAPVSSASYTIVTAAAAPAAAVNLLAATGSNPALPVTAALAMLAAGALLVLRGRRNSRSIPKHR
ncbi:ice-binding family protein [Leifsonia sp. NPDC058230]|uniref:ice-binding family protein n=1 Tax=Leifsonia sp. NPDC058230 TaxID=3346391 RepID=UPI0036DF2AEB